MSSSINIAILGANGQLGQEFKWMAPQYRDIHFEFYSKNQLDILDANAINNALSPGAFDYVINCAAYTKVDAAEQESALCFAVNTEACHSIVDALKGTKTRLIHFSSDYVYHTYNGFPLKENDITQPQGIYAQSKLQGEQILRASGMPVLILRTSWVISSFGHNFVKTMMRLGKEKSSINVVNDQYGTPTYARDLAEKVLDIIQKIESKQIDESAFNDTYNYASEGIITWYDLASQIMTEKGLNCTVQPISSSSFPTLAKRPYWSVMSKHKITRTFGIKVPHWYTVLKGCLNNIG